MAGRTAKTVRVSLSRDSLLDLSEEILASEGQDALTMRRLASAAGATAMALYNHFENREDLLDALVERMFARITLPQAGATLPQAGVAVAKAGARTLPVWDGFLRQLGLAMVGEAKRKPVLFRIAMTRPTKPASAARLRDLTIGRFLEAGLTATQAEHAYVTIAMFLRGLLLYEVERACTQNLPSYGDIEDLYHAGLDVFLDGIRAIAARNGKSKRKKR
jgi:AcrR family transcriptional regulator